MPGNPIKTGYKIQQMYKLPAFQDKYHGLLIFKDKKLGVQWNSQQDLALVLGSLECVLVWDRISRVGFQVVEIRP